MYSNPLSASCSEFIYSACLFLISTLPPLLFLISDFHKICPALCSSPLWLSLSRRKLFTSTIYLPLHYYFWTQVTLGWSLVATGERSLNLSCTLILMCRYSARHHWFVTITRCLLLSVTPNFVSPTHSSFLLTFWLFPFRLTELILSLNSYHHSFLRLHRLIKMAFWFRIRVFEE